MHTLEDVKGYALTGLRLEIARLQKMVEALEGREEKAPQRRRSMTAEERAAISKRMKEMWRKKRKAKA